MIGIIYGPGGSGKSRFQVGIIVHKLRFTRQNICTNLALDLGKLIAYLERVYPGESIDVLGRVRILTRAESAEYWKYRGPLVWSVGPDNAIDMVESTAPFGVCYVIDEAGVVGFSATGWAESVGRSSRGLACLFHLDQQRKFSDDVYASTNGRGPNGIAKGFRDKAHVFIRLENGYLKTLGIFKARGRFTARYYATEPDHRTEPFKVEHFALDETGLASIYRTEEGMGVLGTAADKGQKAKGLSIWWTVPAAAALCALVLVVPWAMGKGAQKALGSGTKVPVTPSEPLATAPGESRGRVDLPHDERRVGSADAAANVTVRGYVVRGSKLNVVLSDGRTLTENDRELQSLDRSGAMVAGRKFWMARPADPPAAKPEQAKPAAKEEKPSTVPDYKGESLFEPSESVGVLAAPTLGGSSSGAMPSRGSGARR